MSNGNPTDLGYSEPDLRAIPDDPYQRRSSGMSPAVKTLLMLGILLLLLGGGWYLYSTYFASKPSTPVNLAKQAEPPSAPAEPAIKNPIDAGASNEPLPKLGESDQAIGDGLAGAMDRDTIARYMIPQDLVRRVVITVDNLPRKTYSQRFSPVKPVAGKFTVAGKEPQLIISSQNAARYTPLVRLFEAMPADKLVAVYTRFYPLFQEAYKEQGYPNAYFNDRLVETIDLMIATRDMPGQLTVTQPKVLYEFADPNLEALPAGQKIMLRMGPENAARVKAKLKEIRPLIAKQGEAAKSASK